MILYFADRKMNILGLASTELPRGFTITEDLKTEEIETGVTTFNCRIPFGPDDRLTVEQLAAVGNYIIRYDGDTNEFYTIVETEVDTEAGDVYLYAEDAGLDLINEVALQWPTDATLDADRGAHPLAWYFGKLLTSGTYEAGDTGGGDTGFELGINEAAGDTAQTLTWSDEATVTERLLEIAEKFECEIGFRFVLDGMSIAHKYVDVYKTRGKDLGVQLRLGTDVERIVTKSSIANLVTALKVTGADDAAGTPVNLEGYTYDDGDFYVASGSLLCSREAHDKWSRYIYAEEPETVKSGSGDIVKTFSYDTVSQQELCEQAIEELKTLREPEINYEVELSNLPDGVKLGDRVTIVDDEGELYVSARILKLETSETEATRTVTLGEYLIRDSGISAQVALLAEQFAAEVAARKQASTDLTTLAATVAENTENIETETAERISAVSAVSAAATAASNAASAAQSTANGAQAAVNAEVTARTTIIREYGGGVLVAKVGQTIGALVNADGSFDVVGITWSGTTPTVTNTIYARYGESAIIQNENGDYLKLSSGAFEFYAETLSDEAGSGMIVDSYAKLKSDQNGIRADFYKYDEEYSSLTHMVRLDRNGLTLLVQNYKIDTGNEYDVEVTTNNYGYLGIQAEITELTTRAFYGNLQEQTTYTSFSTSVDLTGYIYVVKKLGWCQVFGALTLNESTPSTSWTSILSSLEVPAPQHGKYIHQTVPHWGGSYIRFRIGNTGGLQIARGAAGGEYHFSFTYPI